MKNQVLLEEMARCEGVSTTLAHDINSSLSTQEKQKQLLINQVLILDVLSILLMKSDESI